VINEKVKKEYIVLEDIIPRCVNPVKADIYAHKAKPMEGTSTSVNKLMLSKKMQEEYFKIRITIANDNRLPSTCSAP
jgi:hypothetical protein